MSGEGPGSRAKPFSHRPGARPLPALALLAAAATPAWACLGTPTADPGGAEVDGAPVPPADAAPLDAPVTCPDPLLPFQPSNLDRCELVESYGPLELSSPAEQGVYRLDTGTGVWSGNLASMPAGPVVGQEAAPGIRVIVVESFVLAA